MNHSPTLAEIKTFIDNQKPTIDFADKFFTGSKLEDISAKYSDINKHIKELERSNFMGLLTNFFVDNDTKKLFSSAEVNEIDLATIRKSISDLKKAVEEQKKSTSPVDKLNADMATHANTVTTLQASIDKLDKVKIPHQPAHVSNVVYTVASGILDWVSGANNGVTFDNNGVSGCYRFTTLHRDPFKLLVAPPDRTGINTLTFINNSVRFFRVHISSDSEV